MAIVKLQKILYGRRDPHEAIRVANYAVNREFAHVKALSRLTMEEVDRKQGITTFNGRGGRAGYVIKPHRHHRLPMPTLVLRHR